MLDNYVEMGITVFTNDDHDHSGHHRRLGNITMESYDYISAMQHCIYDTDADYLAVIQDDVWATGDFYRKLLNALRQLPVNSMLKLFVTSHYDGWSLGTQWEAVCGSLILGCLFIGIVNACVKDASLTHVSLTKLAITMILLSYGVMMIVGRQNMMYYARRTGVIPYEQNSNALANVFTRRSGTVALDYLVQEQTKGIVRPVDLDIMLWRNYYKVEQYTVLPCLVEHVGLYSSIEDKYWQRSEHSLRQRYKNMKTSRLFEDTCLSSASL